MQRKTPLGIEKRFDRFADWLDRSWALKKADPLLKRYPSVIVVVTWLMRLAVGATFIASGIAKAIDPWGSLYKVMDYLTAMHLPFTEWGNTVLVLVFLLFCSEFLIGVAIFTGTFRKAAPISAALFMLVMLPLTLWIAISDPVPDCGCFGDLFIISNWATFIKNCFLSVAVVWLIKFNRSAVCLITPYLQWIEFIAVSAYVLAVGYVGFWQQPFVDFRPYSIGTRIAEDFEAPEYIPVFTFIYEKDGQRVEIGEDDEVPDEADGWRFVERRQSEFRENPASILGGDVPAGVRTHDFHIWNQEDGEDMSDVLIDSETVYILAIPDIGSLSYSSNWKINRLYDQAKDEGAEFIVVAAGNPDKINEWRDVSSGQFPVYTAEDTSIKELVRGNPALVIVDGGTVAFKTALSAIRFADDTASGFYTSPVARYVSTKDVLILLTTCLVAILGILGLAAHLRRP